MKGFFALVLLAAAICVSEAAWTRMSELKEGSKAWRAANSVDAKKLRAEMRKNVRAWFNKVDKEDLKNIDWGSVDWKNVDFSEVDLSGKEWAKKKDNENVKDQPWADVDWTLVDWTSEKWDNVKWWNIDWKSIDWANVDISEIDWTSPKLQKQGGGGWGRPQMNEVDKEMMDLMRKAMSNKKNRTD